MDDELTFRHEDQLRIPPLFSGSFGNNSRRDRFVGPYGAMLDDENYRDRLE